MIDLFTTDKVAALYSRMKAFVEAELYPIEMELLHQPFHQSAKQLESIREKARQQQLWAPYLPEAEGGKGLSMVEFGQLSELLGKTPFGHYALNCQAPDIGNIELLSQHASPELQERYLHPLIQGHIRSCFSMTEPEFAGSNPTRMGTTARRNGDEYVINGHKWFTTAADGATFAIVMAVTDPDADPYQRASMILVPTDTAGFRLVRNIPIMGEAGEGYLSHAEIQYEDCRVPITHRIGEEGSGFRLAQQRLGPGRIHHCMRWIGICERAFELMCQRAATRQLDDEVLLGHQQTVQHWIAECRADIDAARLLVLHTAHAIDTKGAKAARTEISTIKFFVAQVLDRVLDRAIQTHGALGITDDLVLSFWYRHERGARIYDGPDEVHKSSLARQILKQYGLQRSPR